MVVTRKASFKQKMNPLWVILITTGKMVIIMGKLVGKMVIFIEVIARTARCMG